MPLVIKRSYDTGDRSLLRQPFAEPNPQPSLRLSALSYQGVTGDQVPTVGAADGGQSFRSGTGDIVDYIVPASGVPGYEIDSTLGGVANPKRPTLWTESGATRPIPKSFGLVFRLHRLPTSTVSESVVRNRYGHLVTLGTGGSSTIYMTSLNEQWPGEIVAGGGSGSSWVRGKSIAPDGSLHFAMLVARGSGAGTFYVDDSKYPSTTIQDFNSNQISVGYGYNGMKVDIVEAFSYTEALSDSQVEAKRKHYEALYNFRG